MKTYLLPLILLLCTWSCRPQETPAEEEKVYSYLAPKPKYDEENLPLAVVEHMPLRSSRTQYEEMPDETVLESENPDQKLVRTAHLRMQVKDYTESNRRLRKKIKDHQAFVTDGTEQREGEQLENSLSIRVNNQRFDALVEDLLQESIYLERKQVTVSDVTAEYVDNSARLRTKKKVENRYLDLLTKARTVKDILQIEEELSSLQEEIESKEARLRYLDNQVAFSTINLEYFEKIPAAQSPQNSFANQLQSSISEGWHATVATLLNLISLWPFLLLLGSLVFWITRILRRRRAARLGLI